MSAFYHAFLASLKSKGIPVVVANEYLPRFDELKTSFESGKYLPTECMNSQIFPLIFNKRLRVKRQFSIYDVSGKVFNFSTSMPKTQLQFDYCNGFLFVIDPLKSDNTDTPLWGIVGNFVNYMIDVGNINACERSCIPVSVVIMRAETEKVKKGIGLEMLDRQCRQYLIDIGHSMAIKNLESQFRYVRYFAVSAKGDAQGIAEPIKWMMRNADKKLTTVLFDVKM